METRSRFGAVALALFGNPCAWHGPNTVDDRIVTLHTVRDAEAKRAELIEYLWGKKGFPAQQLPRVTLDVPNPVKELTNLARVDALTMSLGPGLEGFSELVVVHQGHLCRLDDAQSKQGIGRGLERTIAALLREGYAVLGVFMPRQGPGDCRGRHNQLFDIPTAGSPMKFFMEPTAISLNYLRSFARRDHFPEYRAFHMVGFSGGGWTTTLYAAIDPSIRCSFSVAGSIPLYLRSRLGDREQSEVSFYERAGYPDLYVLGSFGMGREQVQILNRRDDCCFGETQHDSQELYSGYQESLQDYQGARARGAAGDGLGILSPGNRRNGSLPHDLPARGRGRDRPRVAEELFNPSHGEPTGIPEAIPRCGPASDSSAGAPDGGSRNLAQQRAQLGERAFGRAEADLFEASIQREHALAVPRQDRPFLAPRGGLDERPGEARVHRFDQQPGPAIGHAEMPGGPGDRSHATDCLEEFRLSGPQGDPVSTAQPPARSDDPSWGRVSSRLS